MGVEHNSSCKVPIFALYSFDGRHQGSDRDIRLIFDVEEILNELFFGCSKGDILDSIGQSLRFLSRHSGRLIFQVDLQKQLS